MMQRWCAKLRTLALQSSHTLSSLSTSTSRRLIHSSTQLHQPFHFAASRCRFRHLNASSTIHYSIVLQPHFVSPPVSLSVIQVRHVSSRERKKRRKPMTPVTSKIKKTKMKFYSSYKSRFRTMSDGNIRRWKEGKRHNAHLKSKKSKRRLRQPAIVPVAYAKVMKKLNFCG
ncbi:hypothetical protein I3760_12G067800 [Carya illinoinensis]|uniref:50S ribosomal protein L35 n=1 Tax=Carya illinoinensis TaxID=32201 RepID=A0A922DHU1_CARIL|nr:hypothetical protein I3760_12G067800 [Carya illinoinensis]KAG6684558.1 hypothetical protein I3842_12G068600 [Carya illinoinensis]